MKCPGGQRCSKSFEPMLKEFDRVKVSHYVPVVFRGRQRVSVQIILVILILKGIFRRERTAPSFPRRPGVEGNGFKSFPSFPRLTLRTAPCTGKAGGTTDEHTVRSPGCNRPQSSTAMVSALVGDAVVMSGVFHTSDRSDRS